MPFIDYMNNVGIKITIYFTTSLLLCPVLQFFSIRMEISQGSHSVNAREQHSFVDLIEHILVVSKWL